MSNLIQYKNLDNVEESGKKLYQKNPYFRSIANILEHPEFVKGNLSTHFIEHHYDEPDRLSEERHLAIAVAAALHDYHSLNKTSAFKRGTLKASGTVSNWKQSGRPGKLKFS